MRSKLILVALVFFVAFTIAFVAAQEGEPAGETEDSPQEQTPSDEEPPESSVDLDTVTITGTKTEKELSQTPVQTEIIDEEFILQSGADSLDDILESAGLQFAENAMGSYIQLQGMSGERVLFLLDGKRVTGRVAGNLVAQTIPLDNIERIEVVRGPQSALYGSDAIGGVINIITKKPDDRVSGEFSLKNSSLPVPDGAAEAWKSLLREQTISGSLSLPIGPASNRLSIWMGQAFPYLDSQGISIYPRYLQGKMGLDSNITPAHSAELSWGGEYSFHRKDTQTSSSGSMDRIDTQRANLYTTGRWIIDDIRDLSATVYYNHFARFKEQYSSLLDIWGDNGDEIEHYVGSDVFFNRFLGKNNELNIGASYAYDQLEKYNIQNSKRQTRHTVSLVVQDEQFKEDAYSAVAGIRGEYSSDYGWFVSPKLSGMLYITDNLRILPAIGVGYRAPTFLELYLDSAGDIYHKYGNAGLEPEKSFGVNLGFEWLAEKTTLKANAFHNELVDEIVYDYTDQYDGNGKQIIVKENLARSFRSGADISASLAFLKLFKARLYYGFLYAYDRSEGSEIKDQPSHRAGARLSLQADGVGLRSHVELNYHGAYKHRDRPLLILNTYVSKTIGRTLEAFLGVDNLTGTTDEYSVYLAGPVIYAGLNARF